MDNLEMIEKEFNQLLEDTKKKINGLLDEKLSLMQEFVFLRMKDSLTREEAEKMAKMFLEKEKRTVDELDKRAENLEKRLKKILEKLKEVEKKT